MKKLIFSSIFLFLLSFINAQPFQEHFINPSAYDADKNFPIDLDQDGDVDLVLINEAREIVFWLEQTAGGIFTQHIITTGIENLRSVFCVDIDNDGDIDVLSGSSTSSVGIIWHQNDGNQNFTSQNIQSSSAAGIFCIDLDEDGDMDMVTASLRSGIISWLENDGNATFTPHEIATSTNCDNIEIGDINKNGSIEIITSGDNNYSKNEINLFSKSIQLQKTKRKSF